MSSVTFCPKCGSMMKPRKGAGGLEMVCIRCGYVIQAGESLSKVEARVSVANRAKSKITVSKEESSAAERVKIVCAKCGNDEAYFWMVQTRAADEPPTRFYRCTRCGYTWREYA